jgi:phage gp16-like protein
MEQKKGTSEDLRKDSDDFIRYCAEIVRRIGRGGFTDIPHLLSLYDQMKRALESVSTQELAWADQQARRLVERLVALNAKLAMLRRLKATLGLPDEDDGGPEQGPPR